jgi:cyclase
MQTHSQTLPTSRHFKLEQLAEGVYAAIATENGLAFSNAGIIDLGSRTLVFDTFDGLAAAEDLCAAAEQLTGHPADWIVNSHAHGDHWSGNQVFAPSASIVATHAAREAMLNMLEEVGRLKTNPAELEMYIQQLRQRLEAETDERLHTALENSIARQVASLETLPRLALRLPDQTFGGKLLLHGSRRTVELHARGSGHTPGDCFLVLPGANIVFTGDLAFFGCPPYMADGDPPAWIAQLECLEQSGLCTFVPGHGPLGDQSDLALERQYILMLRERVTRAIQAGQPVEEVLRQPLPSAFAGWASSPLRLEANAKSMYQQLSPQVSA